jgi:hypothetical protein
MCVVLLRYISNLYDTEIFRLSTVISGYTRFVCGSFYEATGGAGIAQLVLERTTGWTAGVRSPASRPALGPTQHPIQWVSGPPFSGGKAAGA